MLSHWHIFLLFAGGLIAGFINVMAGGGSVITIPILIFTGLPSPLVNATNRVGVFFQGLVSSVEFARQGLLPIRKIFALCIVGMAGAGLGAYLAIGLEEKQLDHIIAVLLILVGLYIVWPSRKKESKDITSLNTSIWYTIFMYAIFFAIGIYGGFIQAGNGFLLIAALQYFKRWDIIAINAAKVFIVLTHTIVAMIIFIQSDLIQWPAGLTLALGTAAGGYLGSRFALRIDEKWVKLIIMIMILLSSLKLWL